MDLVSIIIPYFKKKKFIKKSLVSAIRQTYKNIEIILIYDDDCKKDLNYIKSLLKLDKRIYLYINKKNRGAAISRNIGIKLSKGTYVSFLDADDMWLPSKLKKQLFFLKEKNGLICHTSYQIIDKNDNIIGTRKAFNFCNYESLLKSCNIGLSTVLLKKCLLNNVKYRFPNIKTKEDFVLWLRILKGKNTIHGLNENLVKWKKLDNSLSSSTLQKIKDGFKVYNTFMKYNIVSSVYLLLCLSFNYMKKQ